jgi:UDP-N-acetylmuramoylalanine--D-glutamate ligase
MDLYFEYSPAPICGISGTNGKTTTVNWLSHHLHPSHPHLKGGNDLLSPQCLLSLHTLAPHQLLLLEISNRHLTSLQKTPSLGILTNIAQDHIEEHGGFDAYIQTKYKLVQEMSASQIAILNHEDPLQQILAPRLKAQTYFFGLSPCRGIYAQGDWIYLQLDLKTTARPLLPCKELRLQGTHNLLNGMASALAAFLLGVSETQILQGLRTFSGVRNRLECVASFHSVDYVNDMACTSPHAACAALNHFSRPLLFIAGGDSKGADFESFNTLLAQKAKCLILLPGKLREHLKHPHTFLVSSLKEAVALAKEKACPGDTVLLSPVGTGFFTRFIKGQSSFRNLVKRGFREPSSSASYSSSSHYSS